MIEEMGPVGDQAPGQSLLSPRVPRQSVVDVPHPTMPASAPALTRRRRAISMRTRSEMQTYYGVTVQVLLPEVRVRKL